MVVAGLVMSRNSSWSVVCVYVALGKSRKAEGCGDRSTINVQCYSLGFMLVMPREAGPVVVDWWWSKKAGAFDLVNELD